MAGTGRLASLIHAARTSRCHVRVKKRERAAGHERAVAVALAMLLARQPGRKRCCRTSGLIIVLSKRQLRRWRPLLCWRRCQLLVLVLVEGRDNGTRRSRRWLVAGRDELGCDSGRSQHQNQQPPPPPAPPSHLRAAHIFWLISITTMALETHVVAMSSASAGTTGGLRCAGPWPAPFTVLVADVPAASDGGLPISKVYLRSKFLSTWEKTKIPHLK